MFDLTKDGVTNAFPFDGICCECGAEFASEFWPDEEPACPECGSCDVECA